jgi:predicted O-linked N-acetylglucosamine transferase (SPINDLY family)
MSSNRPGASADADAALARCGALYQQGNLADAETILTALIKRHPGHFDALHLLGIIAARTGRGARAVDFIGRAVRINPHAALAHRHLGHALMDLRRHADAVRSFDAALALRPDLADAHMNRAVALKELERANEALDSVDAAIRLRPDLAAAHILRGAILLDLAHPLDALMSLERGIALEPAAWDAHLNRGIALHGLHRYSEALASYDRAASLRAPDAAACNLRGLVLQHLARTEEALASFEKALSADPAFFDAYNNCGTALAALGRNEDAIQRFTQAIARSPGTPEPYVNRAAVLQRQKRHARALADCDAALARRPEIYEAHLGRGAALRELRRPLEALVALDRAIALHSGDAAAHSARGSVLLDLRRPQDALRSFERAIALDPEYAEAHRNRAAALRDLRRPAEALAAADRALEVSESDALAHSTRAAALIDLRRPSEALNCADAALRQAPDLVSGHLNRAKALCDLERLDEALQSSDAALALAPDSPDAHVAQGSILSALSRPTQALAAFERALTQRPDHVEAAFHASLSCLQAGALERGWELYESRFRPGGPVAIRALDEPRWHGTEPLHGKTLFVHAEQGLGDTLQFCRYADLAVARGARVVMSVHDELQEIIGGLNANIEVLGIAQRPDRFDYQIPLLSLPHAFRTSLQTVPARVPYLHADPARVRRWRERLGGHGFRIGIAWQGSTRKVDVGRSFPLRQFERIAAISGVRLISLQKGAGSEQLAQLPPSMLVEVLGDEFDAGGSAFVDSAAVMKVCDLIITSDTSIAHLAGALGRPTWVALKLSPDWRWLLERPDSPWYPTLRLFRQAQRGDWQRVFDKMEAELRRLIHPIPCGGRMPSNQPPGGITANVQEELVAIRAKAMCLHQQGRLAEALASHDDALLLAPGAIGIRLSAAHLAHLMGLQELSLSHFEQAAQLDPTCYPAVDSARRICVGAGLSERAWRHSQRAYELNPSAETLLSQKLIVPSIAQSTAAIRETRRRYEQALDEVLASKLRFERPEGVLGNAAFFLAYHGENDRELQIKTARMFLHTIPSLAMTAPHCAAGKRRGGKVRVGFISRYFMNHSIFSTSRGLIDQLSRDRFEVFALRIMPSRDDEATAKIRASADHTLDLAPDLYHARDQIAALELDVLFYQDIGMEQTSYFLAFARLARVQCVSFGHPNTTGIPNMDYFISNDLFELPGAESHYSEKLYVLHDLPTLAYYYKPVWSAEAAPQDLGLPAGASLYVCPQTLYKLHPDFDDLLHGILVRDSRAVIVLIAGQFREFTAELRARFARTMPSLASRIVFLPRLSFDRYMQLLSTADVVLDSVHFNGMNSSLECFAVGTPVITLPTRMQRGRHTQAMYRKMGMTDCIANDPRQYVDWAVRVATDRPYAHALRERILANNHRLFEDRRVVEEFERFFTDALRHCP